MIWFFHLAQRHDRSIPDPCANQQGSHTDQQIPANVFQEEKQNQEDGRDQKDSIVPHAVCQKGKQGESCQMIPLFQPFPFCCVDLNQMGKQHQRKDGYGAVFPGEQHNIDRIGIGNDIEPGQGHKEPGAATSVQNIVKVRQSGTESDDLHQYNAVILPLKQLQREPEKQPGMHDRMPVAVLPLQNLFILDNGVPGESTWPVGDLCQKERQKGYQENTNKEGNGSFPLGPLRFLG